MQHYTVSGGSCLPSEQQHCVMLALRLRVNRSAQKCTPTLVCGGCAPLGTSCRRLQVQGNP